MIKVDLYKCSTYDYKNCKKIVNQVVASFPILKNVHGKKIVIKANLVSAMSPSKNGTTNPVLLRAFVDYFIDKKCSVVIGDSPGGTYNEAYLSNIYKVCKMDQTHAKLNDNFNTTSVYFEKGKVLKKFEYTSYLDDADIKINFSKLKSHGMMVMTNSVKNLFGTIPGTLKPEYHYRFPNHKDFANMLIDLNEFFKFDLNITDAIYGMEGNGPTNGKSKKIGCVLASENPYALDYIASKILGCDYKSIPTIVESLDRNLFSIDDIKLNDNLKKYEVSNFEFPNKGSITFYSSKKDIFHKIISWVSNRIFTTKPYPIKRKCIGCMKCARICPAHAITSKNKKAYIDRKKCIKCYCCQEFCPFGAMVVKKSLVSRLINKIKK